LYALNMRLGIRQLVTAITSSRDPDHSVLNAVQLETNLGMESPIRESFQGHPKQIPLLVDFLSEVTIGVRSGRQSSILWFEIAAGHET
jgi:hypothetical protein